MSQEPKLANSYLNQKTSQFQKKFIFIIKYVKPKKTLKTV